MLGDYIAMRRITAADFARRIGYSESTLSRMLSGERRPSTEFIFAVERETQGLVRLRDFPQLSVPSRRGRT